VPRRPDRRKRRTREHVIASLASNFVERVVLECGFTFEVVRHDYGYDLIVFTYDGDGFFEEGHVLFQLKASDSLRLDAGTCSIDVDIRDYNRWISEPMPVFLIAFDASARKGYWLYVQQYFGTIPEYRPGPSAATIRVTIPRQNKVNASFMWHAQRCKSNIVQQFAQRIDHHGSNQTD
jgi:Domain of unknown function (DUF4365)